MTGGKGKTRNTKLESLPMFRISHWLFASHRREHLVRLSVASLGRLTKILTGRNMT